MRSSRSGEFRQSQWLWIVVCILLLAFVLRVADLTSESLWIDEGYSLALARLSIRDIVRGTVADQHPPLYYLLLHVWLFVGRSVFHLRYLSALIGMVSVAVGALIGQQLLGRKAGMVAALLLACSPMHVRYSQEARMYILLALLTALSAYMVWRLMHGLGGWVAYGLITLLALYAHYFAGFIVLLENCLAFGWGLRKRPRDFFPRWLGTQVALGALFAPWLPVALYQVRHHRMTWVRPPTCGIVRDALILMMFGDSALHRGTNLSVAVLGFVVLAVAWSMWRAQKRGQGRTHGFLLLWLVIPFVVIVAISLVLLPLFQTKQVLILVTPLVLLVAVALVELPWGPKWVLAGVLAFFVIGSLSDQYCSNTNDEWREAAQYIERRFRVGDILYLNPAAGVLPLRVYLSRPLSCGGYPQGYSVVRGGWNGERVTADIAGQVMGALRDKHRRIWLVEFGPEFWDPDGHLTAWLECHGQRVAEQSFRGVGVRLYELTRDSGA